MSRAGPTITLLLLALLAGGPAGGQSLSASETYREAYDAGNEDGLSAGREDREQGRLFDFANHRAFQTADRGLDLERHDRDVYMMAYRRGFEDGYEAGYGLNDRDPVPPAAVPGASPPPPRPADPAAAPDLAPLAGTPVTLARGAKIRIRLLNTLSTQRNERGDNFRAEVIEDVTDPAGVVIPEGTRIDGTITHLKRPGRIKGRAELNLRFDELRFRDGRTLPFEARIVSIDERKGEREIKDEEGTVQAGGSKGDDAKNVAKTSALGALLGVLTGGGGGARTGAIIGAVGGLVRVFAGRGKDLHFHSHTEMTIELLTDLEVPAPRARFSRP